MSIAEKLQTIADNQQLVYEAGKQAGGSGMDLTQITNWAYFFCNNSRNALLPALSYEDTCNATSTAMMFYEASELTAVPLFDTSKVTVMNNMFIRCTSLTTIPQFDTSNVTAMYCMFQGCSKLAEIPLLNTGKVTNMANMFYQCPQLTRIPALDTGSATTTAYMFHSCSKLTSVPALDTRNVTDASRMFYGCYALTEIASLNLSSATNLTDTFYYANKLTTIDFEGEIIASIAFPKSPLTAESMKNVIAHLKNYAGTDSEGVNTLTFTAACWTALEASGTAPDGGTWKNYVASLGWLCA